MLVHGSDVMALPTLKHEGREAGGGLPVDEDSVLLDVLAQLQAVEVPGREPVAITAASYSSLVAATVVSSIVTLAGFECEVKNIAFPGFEGKSNCVIAHVYCLTHYYVGVLETNSQFVFSQSKHSLPLLFRMGGAHTSAHRPTQTSMLHYSTYSTYSMPTLDTARSPLLYLVY